MVLFRSGEQIGPYILARELGRGAFGSVWLAQEQSLFEREVALKLPLEEDPDMEAIKREAKTWLRVGNHPNLVPVLNAGVYEGQVAIASMFVSGGTLTQWLRRHHGQAPSTESAIALTCGILSGLEHLHQLRPQPLIHRDLKPANILLEEETETPRITDFGVSRVLKSTASTNISGTPVYMAPEMFEGHYSAQSDLWAAGVMLYQMLAGRLPFQAENMMQLARIIERQDPDPLPETVPPYLRDTLMQTLQKDPMLRIGSATEMRETLLSRASPRSKLNVQSVAKTPFAPVEDQASPGAISASSPIPELPSGRGSLSGGQSVRFPSEPAPRQQTHSETPLEASTMYTPASSPAPSAPDTTYQGTPSPVSSPPVPTPAVKAVPRPLGRVPVYLGLVVLVVLGGGFFAYRAMNSTSSGPPGGPKANTNPGPNTAPAGLTPEQTAALEKQRQEQEARANKEREDRDRAEKLAGQARVAVDRASRLIQQRTMRAEAESACRQALRLSGEALKLDRKNRVALRSRAAAYYALGDVQHTKQAVREGLALYPEDDLLKSLR